MEEETKLGKAATLGQRNVFETEELMLEIPWGPVLRQGYGIAGTFAKQWVRWVPLAHLAQTSPAKQGCVCTGLPGHSLRAEIPQNLEESVTNLLDPQQCLPLSFFFSFSSLKG